MPVRFPVSIIPFSNAIFIEYFAGLKTALSTILTMIDATDWFKTANKLQLHYWFSDKSHTMDALVHNKCERELLEITKAMATICGAAVKMETEPSAKGGLKNWLTISPKSEKKTPHRKITLINALVAASMITPVNASVQPVATQLLATWMQAKELTEEQKELLKQELLQLQAEAKDKFTLVDQSNLIKKRRSNFYELLRKYQKVKSISIVVEDSSRKPCSEEQFVLRDGFRNFILVSDHLKPVVLENVLIEIVSPVLSIGKFKWKGIYNGSPISFSMKSDEFITLVQTGKVEFKSGTTINCTLEIEKKINSEGIEKITSYNIVHVNSYQENGKSIETTEGKQQKQKPEVTKRQLDLFG